MEYVQQLNFNTTSLPVMKTMETIALAKRGQCNWSEKIALINNLSATHQLNVTAALIYDNRTFADISIKTSLYQASINFPSYSSSLPANRSISDMADNDLTQSSIGVYFVPYAYGNSLKAKLNGTYDPANPNIRTLWTMAIYFQQDDSSDGFVGSIRGYLAYIIALAAIFLIGVIFLRWWRVRRMRENFADDLTTNNIHLHSRGNQVDPLPVDIVNALPIKQYEANVSKNVNCAICLEDFVMGKSDVRILPCGHGFCVLCIDPWLTQKSTLCPMCKWDCLPQEIRQGRDHHDTVSMGPSVLMSDHPVTQNNSGNNPIHHLTESHNDLVISVPEELPSSSEQMTERASLHSVCRPNEGTSSIESNNEKREQDTKENC